jgi:hypothetical protein
MAASITGGTAQRATRGHPLKPAAGRRTDEGGKLYAQATSSCMIFRPGG